MLCDIFMIANLTKAEDLPEEGPEIVTIGNLEEEGPEKRDRELKFQPELIENTRDSAQQARKEQLEGGSNSSEAILHGITAPMA